MEEMVLEQKQKPVVKKPKRKLKIKKMVIWAVAIIIAAVLVWKLFFSAPAVLPVMVRETVLMPTTLSNTVDVTGAVESVEATNVYTTLTGIVNTVNVEVGDQVSAGDILCQIDTKDLQESLDKLRATTNSSVRSAQHQLEMSQKAYDRAKTNMENDLNAQLANAKSAMDSAKLSLDNAKKSYQDAQDDYDNNESIGLRQAVDGVDNARDSLHNAKDNYDDLKESLEDQIDAAEEAVDSARAQKKYWDEQVKEAVNDGYKDEYETLNEALKENSNDINTANSNLLKLREDLKQENLTDEQKNKIIEDIAIEQAKLVALQVEKLSLGNQLQNNQWVINYQAYAEADAAVSQAENTLNSLETSGTNNLQSAKSAIRSAERAYDTARSSISTARKTAEKEIEQLQNAYDSAKLAYENALTQQKITDNSTKQELDTYLDNIEQSRLALDTTSSQLEIQSLERKIEESTIIAPVSGTITAVNATEGAAGSGLLFTIEDTSALQISTTIKEYDIADVQEGMPTIIKSDATGDSEYDGSVKEVSPVATRSADKSNPTTTNVQFPAKIMVNSKDTGLRIGMSTRVNIILERKENVYAVPFDAIVTKEDGTTAVYAAVPDESENNKGKGILIVQEVPVTTGMETDFYIEIAGDSLTDGMKVIADATGLMPGQQVASMASMLG